MGVAQFRRRVVVPRLRAAMPQRGASSATKASTQASQTSSTARSQLMPWNDRAPPSPRSSATQPIALRCLDNPLRSAHRLGARPLRFSWPHTDAEVSEACAEEARR